MGVGGYCCFWLHSMTHAQTHNTFGGTPLEEELTRRRDLYLTSHSTHKRYTGAADQRLRRRGSVAARLLGLRFRIPLEAWTGRSLNHESYGVSAIKCNNKPLQLQ
jgi:hypothetical protein